MELTITTGLSKAEQYISGFENLKTRQAYAASLERFFNFLKLENIQSINSFGLVEGERFKAYLGEKYSKKTSSMTIITVKHFFEWLGKKAANENGLKKSLGQTETAWINSDIAQLKGVSVDLREQKTSSLELSEARRMLSVAYNLEGNSTQYKLMLLLLFNAGLRVDELTKLKRSDLTLSKGHIVISILGKGMKRRLVSLSPKVTEEILKILSDSHDGFLFYSDDKSKPVNVSTIWRRVKRIADLANIDKEISPHSLRRTCATIMYANGTPIETIQRLLGHDRPQTTQRYLALEVDEHVSLKHALEITEEE